MKTCTIIISHYESLAFLRASIRQIRKHSHPYVGQTIMVVDQSGNSTHAKLLTEFGNDGDIRIIRTAPLYSGYGIDYAIRYGNITTEYVCQIHVDAFPIHNNWLYLCVKLIEDVGFEFVGQNHFISIKGAPIYPGNGPFFSMSPTFNVAKTSTYREMSLEAGFSRFHARPHIDIPMPFANNDWANWAKEDYDRRGSDDDTVAFNWEDNHREHNKLGLGLSGKMGVDGEESGYGRIYEDVFFHFGFCRESVGVMPQMGERYREWTRRINEGFTDEIIEEMLSHARRIPLDPKERRIGWNGKTKETYKPEESLNNMIEFLKQPF